MKIFHINSTSHGSTGTIARQIIAACEAAGHTGYFAHGLGKVFSEREYLLSTKWKTRWHNICSRVTDRQCFFSRGSTERLVEILREVNPDIIHLHNLHGHYLHIGVLFDYLKNFPGHVVWTLHDCWPFTGHCSHFEFTKCHRWKTGCSNCPGLDCYPPSLGIDSSKRNWRKKRNLFTSVKRMTLVPVSQWLEDCVSHSFLHLLPRVPIYNGVDTSIFEPKKNVVQIRKKYNIDSSFVALACSSTWNRRKGFLDLLELKKIFREEVGVLVLVGLTEKKIRGLPAGIIGIPRTHNSTELAELYSMADVVLNLSREESFGLTTVEGFACGTPGIVFNCTASPELVTPETGFVVEQGDIDGVVAAIETVRSRGKAAYSDACRSRALNCFRKEDRYAEYVKLYEELVGATRD